MLRVLQTGEFTRVGGEKSLRPTCRVVAATNRDLEQEVKAGRFREDLYFRLNVVPIRSPALRERREDIPLLVEQFVRECCDENGLGYKPVDARVLERLKQYEWPGNVRELRNVVERLVIMSDEVIREQDLPPVPPAPRAAGPRSISGATRARRCASSAKRSSPSSSASASPSSSGTSRAPRRRSASNAPTCTRSCARSASTGGDSRPHPERGDWTDFRSTRACAPAWRSRPPPRRLLRSSATRTVDRTGEVTAHRTGSIRKTGSNWGGDRSPDGFDPENWIELAR